ncbi:MAG: helix-turn-helix domain-containing protein [Elusimicrobia bacterium]|nr:helix-turn-helix domain-containing protein [Candidatus Liberimonas magnetica]
MDKQKLIYQKNIQNNIGLKIQIARKEANIKQNKLSKMLNVSNVTVSRWESGGIKPAIETIRKISEITGKPISYFFGEKQVTEPQASYGAIKDIAKLEIAIEAMKKDLQECKDNFKIILKKLEKMQK